MVFKSQSANSDRLSIFLSGEQILIDTDLASKKFVLVESFSYVNYGLSIITSKVRQINVSNETRDTDVSREIVHFNSHLVLKTIKTPVFMFSLLILFD